MRPFRSVFVLAAMVLLLTGLLLSEKEPLNASPASLEYDFTKIGLLYSDGTTRQPDDHAHHLRLLGSQSELPMVFGSNFNARIQSTATHTTRSFHFDVPETNLYNISFTGVLSLDGGYGDIFIELEDQPGEPIKIFSDFDFLKTGSSSYKTENADEVILLPAGTHTITFERKGSSGGSDLSWMYANLLTLTPAELSPNPAYFVKGDIEDLVLHLPVPADNVTGVTYAGGAGSLIQGMDYQLAGNTIVFAHEYLNTLNYGTEQFTVHLANDMQLEWEVVISEPIPKAIVYNFSELSLTDPNTDWYITKLNPTEHPVVTLREDDAQIHSSTRPVAAVRSFSFYVDETGLYDFEFTGTLISNAGTADFYLDTDEFEMGGLKVVDAFEFHRTGAETTRTVQHPEPLHLTEGMHKITLKVIGHAPDRTVGYTYPRQIKLTKLANSVSPAAYVFDGIQPEDLIFILDHHEDASLTDIMHGDYALKLNQDYTVNGNEVTISQEYLSQQPLGVMTLEFKFSEKNSPLAVISIENSTPQVTPDEVRFDKNSPAPSDIIMALSTNGHTFERIRNQEHTLVRDRDYRISADELVLKKEYLAGLDAGEYELEVVFAGVVGPTIHLTIADTGSTISPNQAGFAKGNPAQSDIVITLHPHEQDTVLSQIVYGNESLILGEDYSFLGNQVTLNKQFLSDLPSGVVTLTFVMSDGSEPTLQIHVVEREDSSASITFLSAVLENKTVTVEGAIDSGEGRQVTIMVYNPNGDLEYIGQTVSGQNGQFLFSYVKNKHMRGIYLVKVGGERVTEPETATFTSEKGAPARTSHTNAESAAN